MRKTNLSIGLILSALCLNRGWADAPAPDKNQDTQMMKAAATDAGKAGNSEKGLYVDSIQATKQSIARETLDAFYRDAQDYYHENRYDDALQLLDKIYSVDPNYVDVQSLRDVIRKRKAALTLENNREAISDMMHQGNVAFDSGQNVLAISYWQKALALNPNYEPAKKRIQEVNHALAQRQFETGYIHYHHGDMEDALDAWSNAIALDPTFKQRGLLLLMSRVELNVRRDQETRLAAQAYDLYTQKDLEGSLRTYEELLKIDPRQEEGRRMSAKIKIQLGQTALKTARADQERGLFEEAKREFEMAAHYGYEVPTAQKGIQEADRRLKVQREPKAVKHANPSVEKSTATATPAATASASPQTAPTPAPSRVTADPAAALEHYRQGLSAFKAKDFQRAVNELRSAYQLDPSNERIYIAVQRAEQEWNAAKQQSPANSPPPPAAPNIGSAPAPVSGPGQ